MDSPLPTQPLDILKVVTGLLGKNSGLKKQTNNFRTELFESPHSVVQLLRHTAVFKHGFFLHFDTHMAEKQTERQAKTGGTKQFTSFNLITHKQASSDYIFFASRDIHIECSKQLK